MFHIEADYKPNVVGTYAAEDGTELAIINVGRTHAGGLVLYVADAAEHRSHTDSSGRIMNASPERFTAAPSA